MRTSDWIADFLSKHGATDVFGIPGVVVLDFLYAIDRKRPELTPHLTYHEQAAAFAACGYAQATGKLGVAYATRGPGFTNLITGIADAYYDSVPVMFFTAHSSAESEPEMRVLFNQEIDTVSLVKNITKYAVRIDRVEDLQREMTKAYQQATTGRKGPVFLDILSSVFSKEIEPIEEEKAAAPASSNQAAVSASAEIAARIRAARRPVFLIGNGLRGAENAALMKQLALQSGVPVLSSRAAQDIMPDFPGYFGFVGSRATRYSNFILSKADLVIALGNRMSFPLKSKSFGPVVEHTAVIRVDIDAAEFIRQVPNSTTYAIDVSDILPKLIRENPTYSGSEDWLGVCAELKNQLLTWDRSPLIDKITHMIESSEDGSCYVCDVGNHSFWITTAYAYSHSKNRILYSGSFGSLGCALPKAIGAYYATKYPVICFTGDQGVQMNIQELQYIAQHHLPITIAVLNNDSSGMIREREKDRYHEHYVHTTRESEYGAPNFREIAAAYHIAYEYVDALSDSSDFHFSPSALPKLIEICIDPEADLFPALPQGAPCQDLAPALPRALYDELNQL